MIERNDSKPSDLSARFVQIETKNLNEANFRKIIILIKAPAIKCFFSTESIRYFNLLNTRAFTDFLPRRFLITLYSVASLCISFQSRIRNIELPFGLIFYDILIYARWFVRPFAIFPASIKINEICQICFYFIYDSKGQSLRFVIILF